MNLLCFANVIRVLNLLNALSLWDILIVFGVLSLLSVLCVLGVSSSICAIKFRNITWIKLTKLIWCSKYFKCIKVIARFYGY